VGSGRWQSLALFLYAFLTALGAGFTLHFRNDPLQFNGSKPMRRRGGLGLALSVCLFLAGCGDGGGKQPYRIAVIPKGTTHDFWKSIHAGAEHAARERGNVRVLWEGPAKEDQRSEQQQIVERFTSEGVRAIVLAPCDRQTLVVPVERALSGGIPVVIMDSGLELSDKIQNSDKYLGYVATDNHQGGVEAAKRMIELVKGKPHAQVMMIRYQTGSQSTEQREAGFRETIQAAPNITFIQAPDEAGATVDSAQRVAELVLSEQKDLDGIFVPNESSTTGVLRALESLHKSGQVKLVGFDSSEVLIDALRNGKLDGLVLQDPFDMGYQSVMRCVDFLEGKPPPADRTCHTNLQVVTKENLNESAIKPLYARDLKPFLGE
jgi:ribose transport system substrate-binding protein